MRDRENRTVGIVSRDPEKEAEWSERVQNPSTPDVMWMELEHPDLGQRATEVRRTEILTMSFMKSENPDHPSFVALVLGFPGRDATYAPLTAQQCESFATQFLSVAKAMREEEGESSN